MLGPMSAAVAAMLEQARRLSPEERAELARELLADLEESESPGWAAAWKAELARRHAAYEAGESKPLPWDEVRARMKARLDPR